MKDDMILTSQSKLDEKDKQIAKLNKEISYWINAYQEEVKRKGRSNE